MTPWILLALMLALAAGAAFTLLWARWRASRPPDVQAAVARAERRHLREASAALDDAEVAAGIERAQAGGEPPAETLSSRR